MSLHQAQFVCLHQEQKLTVYEGADAVGINCLRIRLQNMSEKRSVNPKASLPYEAMVLAVAEPFLSSGSVSSVCSL